MSEYKVELVNEINRLRYNPKRYSSTLRDYMTCFHGKALVFPGANGGIETEEGAAAYQEAVDYLLQQERRELLTPSKGLCRICEDYVAQCKQTEEMENIDMDKIINKYGTFRGSFSRAIDFGGETPENVVVFLTVCDGDKSRGQRNTILNPEAKLVGVATGKHPSFGYFNVIITCTKFNNKVDADDNGFLDAQSRAMKVDEFANHNDDEDEVVSTEIKEEIIVENGKKKKLIKTIKNLKDGRKRVETSKQDIE